MTAPPYYPRIEIDGHTYFPDPYSLETLPSDLRVGLIPVAVLAMLSVGASLTLISFIVYRLITWRMHYRTFLGYNQYVLLVLNLLIADLQQSSAFMISWNWIRVDAILAPSPPCFAQAWLLHSGDISSGFFVLAIALHTFITAVYGKRIGHKTFAVVIICIWAFSYFLTGLGVGLFKEKYFVRAGAWCWISEKYEDERLAFHYFWVFLVQFGTVVIYIVTFFMLRKKTKQIFANAGQGQDQPNIATVKAVNRITTLMTLYPCVYVILTLPLSAGRMWSMAHHATPYSNGYACFAGAMITSCGWVDTLLYTLTRRRLLRDTMPQSSAARRTRTSDWDNDLGSKGITHTRTVTVENGQMLDTLGPAEYSEQMQVQQNLAYERTPSPNGSVDPILSGGGYVGKTKTEVSVGHLDITDEGSEHSDKQDEIINLPPGWVHHRGDV